MTGRSCFGFKSDESFHLRKLKLLAKRKNIPPADGKGWWFFGSPQVEDDLFQDSGNNGYVDVLKYAPSGAEGALNGEIGKVGNIRFAIDNDAITDLVGTGTAFGTGFLLGDEAINEVMVYPMHLRVNMNAGGDFANAQAMCWQMLLGYKVIWNFTAHGQASYIHYTSA